ncbi:MAG TPA: response regulator transcription factor [Thermoanaerobaculia bacterium]|nr:response regulator transcription factor [Thermoanaerobaculia bacterium]
MRILVVEDEAKVASFVRKGLEEQGFAVEVSLHGDEAYELARTRAYDAIVLDIMLPGRDGLSILANLRAQRNPVPVLLLTARSELDERVQGLNLGADDYLTKPFFLEELIARLHALGRRRGGDQGSVLQAGSVTVSLLTREVRRGDEPVSLTSREFHLLEVLLRTPGRVFTRTQLLERVWGYDFDPQTNLVDVNIQRLRKKIDLDGEESIIETVRGVGYRVRKA